MLVSKNINLKIFIYNFNSIIKYKFNYSYSIMTIETLIETIKFKKNIPLKILDIENILKSPLIESINYLDDNNHEYNFLLFPKYNLTFLKDKNIMSQKDISFLKKFNTNIMINNNYLNIDFIKNNKNKYDIINNGLRAIDLYNNMYYDGPFIEIASTQIFFLIFLFAITHLNKRGYLILHIGSVTTKPVADILVLGKKYFKNVVLYQTKIKRWQYTGVSAIFQEFKSINQKDINKLLKIAEKLLKNDPTSLGFTINNDKIRKEYNFT